MGIAIIFIFLASFLNSKSPLDILLFTIGIIGIIIGFYIQDGKINKTVSYFVAMFSVNVFQWLIVIYILLFISQIQLYGDFLVILTIAPLTTISLIVQIRTSDLKYLGNRQMTNKDVILADKMIWVLNDKAKIVLIFTGFVIMLACLLSFIFSKSPLELFGCSVGLMVILWGFYRDGKHAKTQEYTPGLAHNRYYRETKNIQVTVTYFLIMAGLLIFQWFIMYYISFIYQFYVPYEVYKAEWSCIPYTFAFSFLATFYFYVQIRESDLKYIGNRKNNNKITINNGYLVCNKCNQYYKLLEDESPEDFTDQCECGGKLEYREDI